MQELLDLQPSFRSNALRCAGLSLSLSGLLAFSAACNALAPRNSGGSTSSAAAPTSVESISEPVSLPKFDVLHYALDLRLDPLRRSFSGECNVGFTARDKEVFRLSLDCEGLMVSNVFDSQGRPLRFANVGGVLDIDLLDPVVRNQKETVAIHYSAQPRKGLYFAGDENGQATHVFTQGECEDSRWWFPCYDQPAERATSEIRVDMPAGWTSIAAGQRVDRVENGERVIERWSMDFSHPAYLTTLTAGKFTVQTGDWEGVPLLFVSEPQYARTLAATFAETDDVLAFYSDLTGLRYPYAKYAQVAVDNFPFGGMENISATTLTDTALCDERGLRDGGAVGLIAHEAAHQWYGDALTCADWSHAWLNEGFATYLTNLYFEASRSVDEFRARMRDTQDSYVSADLGAARRPTVYGVYKDPMDLFFSGGQTYAGGAARLHLLRYVLGDERFFQALRTYTVENQNRAVVTDDLRRAFEKASGTDLGGFFEQWFYSAGYPEFNVSWKWDEGTGKLALRVRQVQETAFGTPFVFNTPVDIEVASAGGKNAYRLQLGQRDQTFELDAPLRPTWVLFDKYSWIPKRLTQERSGEEWLALASGSDDVNARRDACVALGNLAREYRAKDPQRYEVYVAELVNRLRKDSSSFGRKSAATALGVAGGPEARERLMGASALDQDSDVRETALLALCEFGPDAQLAGFARDQYAGGWSWDTMSAAAALVVSSDPAEAYGWLSNKLFESSPHDQLRAALLGQMAKLDNPGVNSQLRRWATDTSTDPSARAVAVRELGRRGQNQPEVRQLLVSLLDSQDYRLRSAAIGGLSDLNEQQSKQALRAYYQRSIDPREKRTIEAALLRGN